MTDRRSSFSSDKLFFTADTHFGHRKIAEMRGFRKTAGTDDDMRTAHDFEIMAAWNRVVPPDANVIHLGDVTFRGVKETQAIMNRLNGTIFLVPGNHDRMKNVGKQPLRLLPRLCEIEIINEQAEGLAGLLEIVTLCHYPLAAWDNSVRGAIHLHGHQHTGLVPGDSHHVVPPVRTGQVRLDVGLDAAFGFDPANPLAPIPASLLLARAASIRGQRR